MALNQLKQAQQQQQLAAAAAASGVASSPDAAASNQQSGSSRGEKDVQQTDGLPPEFPVLSHGNEGDEQRDSEKRRSRLKLSSKTAPKGQRMPSLEIQLPRSKCKTRISTPVQSDSASGLPLTNLQRQLVGNSSKSQSHNKRRKAVLNTECIVQLDGPISDAIQSSKVIVQLDGGGGGDSSSEDDSDAEEDSSEVSLFL